MPYPRGARVLYVDDDRDSREMLRLLLRSSRIEVEAVSTAAQALTSLQIERFDLYLLDAWLPDLDGFELCRRIRQLLPHAPILFFSGAAYPADKRRAFAAGANGYVVKPEIDELLSTVKHLVSVTNRPVAVEIQSNRMARIPRLSPASLREPSYVG